MSETAKSVRLMVLLSLFMMLLLFSLTGCAKKQPIKIISLEEACLKIKGTPVPSPTPSGVPFVVCVLD